MTTIRLHEGHLHLHLSTTEKVLGLLRDQRVPLSAVRSAHVEPDGLAAARGIRAPGLGLPGLRLIGTWRRRGHRALVSVRRGRPALHVVLEGQRWSELLVDVDDPHGTAAALVTAASR